MKLYMLVLSAAALLAGRMALGQNPPAGRDFSSAPSAGHERAVAAIRKLGGEVKVDSKQPGAPVTVVLTGSASPGECLPYLKELANLRTCNL